MWKLQRGGCVKGAGGDGDGRKRDGPLCCNTETNCTAQQQRRTRKTAMSKFSALLDDKDFWSRWWCSVTRPPPTTEHPRITPRGYYWSTNIRTHRTESACSTITQAGLSHTRTHTDTLIPGEQEGWHCHEQRPALCSGYWFNLIWHSVYRERPIGVYMMHIFLVQDRFN